MTEPEYDDFTPEGYGALIGGLLQRGYGIAEYENVRPSSPDLVLRHDVDITIDAALEMARIEAKIGVTSTYFVLVRSELYNPFTLLFQESVGEILSLGHKLGLHFDPTNYMTSTEEMDAAAGRECNILEQVTGAEVLTISFHRPPKAIIPYSKRLAGRIQTYSPAFINDIGYCSDSRGEWRFGRPEAHPSVIDRTALQLLTHPIWWLSQGKTREEKLVNYVRNTQDRRKKVLAENCEPYRNILGSIFSA